MNEGVPYYVFKQPTINKEVDQLVPEKGEIVRRGRKKPVPFEQKDESYWSYRVKNNASARLSRMRRKFYDEMSGRYDEMARRHSEMERQLRVIKVENDNLRRWLSDLILQTKSQSLSTYSHQRKANNYFIEISDDEECKSDSEMSSTYSGKSDIEHYDCVSWKQMKNVIQIGSASIKRSTSADASVNGNPDTAVLPHKIRIKQRFHSAFSLQYG